MLEICNCLYTHQYGFRNQRSTIHVLITIIEIIRLALDNGKITCGVFLDLQKAFDTVDHQILISKLEHYGIHGIPLNNAQSETFFNEYGVPQGSALGPLLFLIYINDLHDATNYSDIHHFADDTNLLYSSKSLKDIHNKINFDLKSLVHWLRVNKISLNTS